MSKTKAPKRTKSAKATANSTPRRVLSAENKAIKLLGRYDAAQTTTENERHLANADALSAKAATEPAIRRKLRIYARYEVANCPLARNIVRQQADFTIGTGPRLQVQSNSRDYNRAVERAFVDWTIATNWSRKLWQMRYAKSVNGEAFLQFFSNPPMRTRSQPVTLDMRTIEADQVADPTFFGDEGMDGIITDDFGNVVGYRVLRNHPGDTTAVTIYGESDTISASDMVHYYHAERPGQVRGVPEITAALPYLSMRRRYILAVIAAAETAADLAGMIETQGSVEDPDDVEPLDAIDIERRMLMTLPRGWKMSQLKAEQPTTTLEMFDRVIIREVGRCIGMPYGIAGSDSSQYNFASGKLDQSPWSQSVRIEQDFIEDVVTRPAFAKWYEEARLIPGYLPDPPEDFRGAAPPHKWFWDGSDFLDPREAGARDIALKNGTETHGRIFAKRGADAIEEWEAEAALLGITLDEYRQRVLDATFKASGTAATNSDEETSNVEE